jgi:hypothetical protein
MELNKFQTQLTEELKKELPKKIWNDISDALDTIPFIQWLASDSRGTIKDRPWKLDSNGTPTGKKEIDITKPHFLENMDWFRERALYFKEHGVYTHLPKNPNPKSDYALFWKEEVRRWKKGLTRPDGEWIPGSLYFYWNYVQISLVKKVEGTKKGERVKDFPRVYLGDYLWFHYCDQAQIRGKHGKMLKSRGIGASMKFGAESPRNMYTKPGSGNPNFHLASDKTFLLGDKGIWGKILDNLDFIAENTPLPKLRLVDKKQAMELQLGYEDEYGSRKGLLTSVFGISLKDNPDKARGIRGALIHYEEDGLFPNLEHAWNVNREACEEDGVAFAFMCAAGTGGVEGASFEGSEKLFYQPDAYNIYGIPNVFDKNVDGSRDCGFFWGAYLNRGESVTKENGEPDVIGSLINIFKERLKIAQSSNDPRALTQKKAESPITPQEAIMRTEGTVFPVSDLKDYISDVRPNEQQFVRSHYVGRLKLAGEGLIEWTPDADVNPLRKYNDSNPDKTGGLEIFVQPVKNAPKYRYIAGIDPIDADSGTSLASIFIFDMFTDQIVAEYTGRPKFADDFYEICRRMLIYYNAIGNYEQNLKGLFSYFSNKNSLHLLCDTPQILKDVDMASSKPSYGNTAKGTRANKEVNKWGRRLQADWMNTQALNPEIDKDGNEIVVPNLRKIRSLAYIDECIAWNEDGNFDRVSAMGMLMILREEVKKYSQKSEGHTKANILANDPYWDKVLGFKNTPKEMKFSWEK